MNEFNPKNAAPPDIHPDEETPFPPDALEKVLSFKAASPRAGFPDKAPPAEVSLPSFFRGTVISGQDGTCQILGENGPLSARTAASCLLRPEAGDLVLLFADKLGAYILSVLERSPSSSLSAGSLGEGAPAVINLPADTLIQGESISLNAERLKLSARDSELESARTTFKGTVGIFRFADLSLQARNLFQTAKHFFCRSRSMKVRSEEAVDVSASKIKLSAKDDLRLKGDLIDLKAQSVARVDGENVRLG
ncbi:MAG: DUF3540 domain-containing protein [Deltaproteobacteria bacterium]|jgi:hypothetical protein|nr:DUF3540 domain-containing protein [Deltaproteobacteria bacterium]